MNIETAEKFLSQARLAPYIKAASGSLQIALQLYADNALLAQSFYTPLSLLEVSFRNALHNGLTSHFSTSDWLLTEQQGFMVHPSLPTFFDSKQNKRVPKDTLLKQVREVHKTLSKNKMLQQPIGGERLIPELTFGFWTMFFEEAYYKVLYGKPISIFPKRPATEDRASISHKLTEVRRFRNRVYHYEPLCFQNNPGRPLCLSHLAHKHQLIVNLIGWLEPNIGKWLAGFDILPATLAAMQTKYPAAR